MDNTFGLLGKAILVTGASSGIGRATAVFLSKLGAKIILVGRRQEELELTLDTLTNKSIHTIEIADLSEIDNIPQLFKKIVSNIGEPLHGLVHCAGIHMATPFRFITKKQLENVFDINLYSGISMIKGFSQRGIAVSGGSSIVLISSIAGIKSEPGVVAYSASKAALIATAKSAAVELASQGIRVNCVAPAIVKTPMSEELSSAVSEEQFQNLISKHLLGLGEPEDVAHAAGFLLSPLARWITGTTMIVDGGYSCSI